MKRQTALSILFLAALSFGSGASATSEINKCVSPGGQVTLTDEACPGDAQAVKLASQQAETDEPVLASPAVRTLMVERYALPRNPPRFSKPVRSAPARGLALDVATLKAARANMMLFDISRTQRIAGMP